MDIEPLKIKTRTNYNWDDIVYINDFDSNLLVVIKRESKIGGNIYYIGYVLNSYYDYNTINPLYFVINRLIGYIEEIKGSSDKYLVVAKSMRNRKIIHSFDTIWSHIEHKINPNNFNNKIKDYDKLRFNSDIDLPLDTLIEFRYLDECLYVKNNT